MRIVGIVLVRNEDIHLARALANIAEFCDRIVVADHASTDDTPLIVREMTALYPHIEPHLVRHPRESHALISGLASSDTWIFGVDGDEIYDPVRLGEMRTRMLRGEFADRWMILGNVLNCDAVDEQASTASGWLAPPCRSITKLYNFAHIRSWDGVKEERLHGGRVDFLPGRDASVRLNLHEQTAWDDTPLRCLHTCFLPRSSRDTTDPAARPNIQETHAAGLTARLSRLLRGQKTEGDWKRSRYARGERVTVDATPFFP